VRQGVLRRIGPSERAHREQFRKLRSQHYKIAGAALLRDRQAHAHNMAQENADDDDDDDEDDDDDDEEEGAGPAISSSSSSSSAAPPSARRGGRS
jgi:hypothetical protein